MYYFYGKINQGHIVRCMEVVRISEILSWEVPLYEVTSTKHVPVYAKFG